MNKTPAILSAALFLALLSPSANAQLLVEDLFDYNLANNASMLNVANTGTGLQGNYNAGGTALYQTSSLAFGSLINGGGSLLLNDLSDANNNARASVRLASGIQSSVTGTLYGSYLFQITSRSTNTGSFSTIRMNSAVGGGGGTAWMTSAANNSTDDGIGISRHNNTTTNLASPVPSLNTTYLVLTEFTNVNAGNVSGQASMWVLTLNQFEYFKGTGLTTTALNGATLGGGDANIFSRVSTTAATGSTPFTDATWMQLVSYSVVDNAGNQTTIYDAVRFGSSLDFVTPIPEPSSALLGLLGLGAMLLRRRMKRVA